MRESIPSTKNRTTTVRLYSGMSREFIDHAVHNRIAALLRDAFQRAFRYRPSPSEENSWRNSLRAVSQVFEHGRLLDHGIILVRGRRISGRARVDGERRVSNMAEAEATDGGCRRGG